MPFETVQFNGGSGCGTLNERTKEAIFGLVRKVRRSMVMRLPWFCLYFFLCAAESEPTSWISSYLHDLLIRHWEISLIRSKIDGEKETRKEEKDLQSYAGVFV